MSKTTIYRKRYYPEELIKLKDDIILYQTPKLIITKWNTLKPRKDISHGISAYYIENGFKISKIFNSQSQLVYWYCDIIETAYEENNNSYIFTDLLIDILVYPDNQIRVLDLDEIGDILTKGLITTAQVSKALHIANDLLTEIYNNNFSQYQQCINEIENFRIK